ncbi:hypothetical protein SAMN05428976_1257 [Clostridium sp. USBA 49]|nr:hypothetical protein SAMN05428976_1257 [Clostridium sp. USBA 49]
MEEINIYKIFLGGQCVFDLKKCKFLFIKEKKVERKEN